MILYPVRGDDVVLIPLEDAREIVAAMDSLDALARQRGYRLSRTVARITQNLRAATTNGLNVTGGVAGDRDSVPVEHVVEALLSEQPGWITTKEAAKRLGCGESNVRDLVSRKRLPSIKRAGRRWISAEDIEAMIDERRRHDA